MFLSLAYPHETGGTNIHKRESYPFLMARLADQEIIITELNLLEKHCGTQSNIMLMLSYHPNETWKEKCVVELS